jgi:tetratricopeptide (TPR) repeat protein
LSYIYGQLGQDQKGFEAARKSVELNPMFQTAWQNYQAFAAKSKAKADLLPVPEMMVRLSKLIDQKKFVEAKAISEELVRLLPANADLGVSHANILFYLNDADGASQEYERVLKMVPGFEAAHINLAKIYQSRGNMVKARYYYERALDINHDNAEVKAALQNLPR